MTRQFSRYGRIRARTRFGVLTMAVALPASVVFSVQVVHAATNGTAAPAMFGYAAGPLQHNGTAAGKPHAVPASATRATPTGTGGRAPTPNLAPPRMVARTPVNTGVATMAAGHLVTPTVPGDTAVKSPDATKAPAVISGDNASYTVATTFDTVPMANQNGRIAVTLTNTGTTTWSTGYGLATQLFPSGDTTGTGAPLAQGPNVAIPATEAPGAAVTVQSVTPAATPGSYELCWEMSTASGAAFPTVGGSEYCAPYSVQQYPPVINEQEPLPGTDVDTQTPLLSASATVPGGYPATPQFSFAFRILTSTSTGFGSVLQSSGWVADNGNSWTPTALTWGTTYYWQATVTDAATPPTLSGQGITWTTPISFVVGDAQPKITSRLGNAYQADDGNPLMTAGLGGTDYTKSGRTVDPRTGNVSQQATDANLETVGPALSVVRTYNSLDPRTGQTFGAGWSSLPDMALTPDPDGSGALILTLADGRQVRFAKNAAGGYAPPQGQYAVVNPLAGGGFTVTDQTGTTYGFGQASGSSWLISRITDEVGRAETFTYAAGALATVTNTTSGRSLSLTWTRPAGASSPHVATVTTNPVTAGQPGTALTWTYGYTGDLLASVCAPVSTTACTTYGYTTTGSHGPTSVLNAAPTSYWRLNDPAGTTAAANQIPVDDLTTMDPPATEMNTTLGVPGPIPGATATGFNGTNSFIPLDGAWCTTPNQISSCLAVGNTSRLLGAGGSVAVSIWFKTSTAGGALVGISASLPGPAGQNCGLACFGGTPLLWIGANGHLDGADATTPFTSPAAVDNGAWHQAVLVPGQALYLDGVRIGTGTGTFAPPSSSYAVIGAGEVTQNQSVSWSYFNGALADLSIYQNDLPSVGTVAAQYAAETHPAAELTSVTSPAGRHEFSAGYDTVNDRVASLTDANGGIWTYGDAVRGSSSVAYDNTVLSSSPVDFWPLNDAAGPLAADQIGGAATASNPRPSATYANVTLGVPGPTAFADGTAASFAGNGSQVSIPGAYFTGGPESVELWFNTKKSGTLLSASTPQSNGEPPLLWVDSNGCLNGSIGNVQVATPFMQCGAAKVNDGNWHQVVLTLGPVAVQTPSYPFPGNQGPPTQTATLYLDKTVVTSVAATPFTVATTGYGAVIGNGPMGDFTGSIADASFYTTLLSSTDVTAHYTALQNQITLQQPSSNPFLPPVIIPTPTLNTETIAVTDPVGKQAKYVYASGSLVRVTDELGGTTYYGYDAATRASTITDPDGDTTYVTYDIHNNVTATTTCAAVDNCQTVHSAYFENLANPLDPRNDKPTDSRDPRSSSPSDPTYDTVTTYTPAGLVATTTTPATPACPSGCTTADTYTAGTEPAAGGGAEPPGLIASITTPAGAVTRYSYDSAGDLAQTTNRLGLVSTYTYDSLGRQLSDTEVSDTYPAGLTTSHSYDGLDRVVTETDPAATDRVTGAVHTQTTSYTYDPDSSVLTTTIGDATGGDPSRTTTRTFTALGQLLASTDPLGNRTSYTYDAFGDRVSVTDAAGQTTDYTYDALGHLLTTVLVGYTGDPANPQPPANLTEESRAYDPAGRLASVTNVKGTETDYTYYGDNRPAATYVVTTTGRQLETGFTYDANGHAVSETQPGGLVTQATYDAAGELLTQTADPSGVDRTATFGYDVDGNAVSTKLTGGGATQTRSTTYNAMDEELSTTVANTGGNLTTSVTRDQRGVVTSQTDPLGNTTYVQNDESGRAVVETDPAVSAQDGSGAPPVTAHPVTLLGFDTFGDKVETSDPNGNVTTTAYDQDGRATSVADPSYTPPGSTAPINGTTSTIYDALGRQTSVTDPVGNTTKLAYDQLGDTTSQTDPDGGVWHFTYDAASEQLSVTDPTGAQTQATYDPLGHVATTSVLVRQNTSAAYTTHYAYDTAGNQTSQTSPTGVTNSATYDAAGEATATTDGAGRSTSYAYNLDGVLTAATAPDGTAVNVTYDPAGRLTSLSDMDTTGAVLRTQSSTYDADGHVVATKDFAGNTATATYDATGTMSSVTEPVSAGHTVTTHFGHDLDGGTTSQTDGNGNTTYVTYNPLGMPATVVEPPAGGHTSAADSTITDSYDGNGNVVAQQFPGGVRITNTYDSMDRLTAQSGTGANAPTATRGYTYDQAGRMLTATTGAAGTAGTFGYQAATSETFGYDDRGLLLSATGSAGTSGFGYNSSGQPTSVTDAAGTSTYTYDTAGRLATDADAASGATGTYSYNSLDQVTAISYGTGKDTQAFGYDNLHRLTSDTVTTPTGGQVAAIGYGYNANDSVTSMTTGGLATPGTGGTGTVTNTYGYDQMDRLTSWTATPAGGAATTKAYGYDDAGNLTNDNGITNTYDARDQLVADSNGNSYTYTADGNLAGQSGPGSASYTYTSDAYGQQITDGSSSFTWDAVNRVIGAGKSTDATYHAPLTYDGISTEVASDPTDTYSRDPAGGIVGVRSATGGPTLALNDQHDDLAGVFTAAGTALTGSVSYDPWGQVLASNGPAVQLGYQGQWTDPVSGQTDMGSRFYRAGTGGFVNRDTASASGGTVIGNAFAYADDNPMSETDPTGHAPSPGGAGTSLITPAEVAAAKAVANEAKHKMQRALAESVAAAVGAARYGKDAAAASAEAHRLNTQAQRLADQASIAGQEAVSAYDAAQRELAAAMTWQKEAQVALEQAWAAGAAAPSGASNAGGSQSDTPCQQSNMPTVLDPGVPFGEGPVGTVLYGCVRTISAVTPSPAYWRSVAAADMQHYQEAIAAYGKDMNLYAKYLAQEHQLQAEANQLYAEANHESGVARGDFVKATALGVLAHLRYQEFQFYLREYTADEAYYVALVALEKAQHAHRSPVPAPRRSPKPKPGPGPTAPPVPVSDTRPVPTKPKTNTKPHGCTPQINYEPLQNGQAQGVNAVLCPSSYKTGTRPTVDIRSLPGGQVNADLARCHLLGAQLGGSGSDRRNLVACYQNSTNRAMSNDENKIAKWLKAGQKVYLVAVALNPRPRSSLDTLPVVKKPSRLKPDHGRSRPPWSAVSRIMRTTQAVYL